MNIPTRSFKHFDLGIYILALKFTWKIKIYTSTKIPKNKTDNYLSSCWGKENKGSFGFRVPAYSPSWLGSPGSSSSRWLVPLYPRSGRKNEKYPSQIPLSSVQSSSTARGYSIHIECHFSLLSTQPRNRSQIGPGFPCCS